MRPQRRQPTRLPCPWDSPGKNTGVGCHFLLQCTKVKSESEVAQSCLALSDPMDCSLPGSSIHGILQARVLEWGAIAFSVEIQTDHLFPNLFAMEHVCKFVCKIGVCTMSFLSPPIRLACPASPKIIIPTEFPFLSLNIRHFCFLSI